jgi:hypothetical protein
LTAVTANTPAVVKPQPLAPLDLDQTKAAMEAYQRGVQGLLAETDWQRFEDRKGEKHSFVKKSGWRKIAMWFSLDVTIVSQNIERGKDERIVRAYAVARATAPNGRIMDGDGACDKTERVFSKPEHDIPATAITRAKNRAISDMVGAGEVSAEEIIAGGDTLDAETAPYGPLATEDQIAQAITAIQKAWPEVDGRIFLDLLAKGQSFRDSGLPAAAAITVQSLAWWLEHEPGKTSADAGDPQGDSAGAKEA